MTRRYKLILVALVLLALLGGGYTYFWRSMAALLEQGIVDWAANERAAGREVAFDDAPVTGFPFAFRRQFQGISLTAPVADGMWSITNASATATMRPWQWRAIDFAATAPVEVTFTVAGQPPLALELARAQGKIRLMSDGRLEQFTVVADGASLAAEAGTYQATKASIQAEFPPLHARAHTDPLLSVGLNVTGLALPDGALALTADPIAKLELAATILGPLPLDLPPRQAVARWAENGGTVELTRFAFAQAPLDLEGEGTLALDQNQQLLGALTLRAVGLPETIDLLAAKGVVAGNAATTGRMMAEGLAKTDAKGRKVARIALSLQQGFVWLGPIRLAPLPALTWE